MNDRQGSITALLKQNGAVSERYSYDAWGRRRNPANWNDYNVPAPTLINRGYTGHEHLDGFGLINMNGRMYDPVIGRVLSPDKVVQAPGYTQSYNRYSYCMNNPLRYTDPSGWYTLADMKARYNWEGAGFWYRGSYQQNTNDGWVSWNPSFTSGTGWAIGATPLNNPGVSFEATHTQIDTPNGKVWVPNNQITILKPVYGTAWAGGDPENLGFKRSYFKGWEEVKTDSKADTKTNLNFFSVALSALGIAISGLDLSIPKDIQIAIYNIKGVKTILNSTQVLKFLKATTPYTIGAGIAVDVMLLLTGDPDASWQKTLLNTGIGLVAASIGGVPEIVLVVGYLALDKSGAFKININAPLYNVPLNVPDATNYVNPYYKPK
jgi:RHS repeat-associated protein